MMGDEKHSDFYSNFKQDSSAENLVTLRRRHSALKEHITRLIAKLMKNFLWIACLQEQLYQILEKLKGLSDKYITSAMNPEDIENASEIYFEQQTRVIATRAFEEQFVIKQQEVQSNIPTFQQDQYRNILRSKSKS